MARGWRREEVGMVLGAGGQSGDWEGIKMIEPSVRGAWLESDRNWCEGVTVFIAIYGSLELELAL